MAVYSRVNIELYLHNRKKEKQKKIETKQKISDIQLPSYSEHWTRRNICLVHERVMCVCVI